MKTNESSYRSIQPDRFSIIEVADAVAATIGGGIAIAVRAESSDAGTIASVFVDPAARVGFLPFDSATDDRGSTAIEQIISTPNLDVRLSNRTHGSIERRYSRSQTRTLRRGFRFAFD